MIAARYGVHGSSQTVAVVEDEPDPRALDRRIAEIESRHQLALLAAEAAIWDLDVATGAVTWSESTAALFGHAGAALGHTLAGRDARIHADDRERVQRGLRAAIEGVGRVWETEYRFQRGAGDHVPVSERVVVDRDPRGTAVRVVGAIRDLSPRLRVVEAERTSRDQHSASLRDAARPGKAEAFDRLVSIVSHDLRGPLGTIAMASTLLRGERPDAKDKRLDAIERATERMKSLITDLLDMSAIEGGRLVLDRKPEDLLAVVREGLELARPQAAAKAIALDEELAASVPVVDCDRARVLQVLAHLLGNAFARTAKQGRVTVRVGAASADGVEIAVIDSGPVIAADQLPHVLDRFDRGGAGLGLAIAKGFVDAHGGTIRVTSEPERGTAFAFVLSTTPSR